jgi:predicted nucleic acid-binding protein
VIVVADTTPLLYLSRVGQLDLLLALYHQIIVPETVWREAVVARSDAMGVESLRAAAWIVVSDAIPLERLPEVPIRPAP